MKRFPNIGFPKKTLILWGVLVLQSLGVQGQKMYNILYHFVDSLSEAHKIVNLETQFDTREDAVLYVKKLPSLLNSRGYIAASVDSVRFDSLNAVIFLFFGEKYQFHFFNLDSIEIAAIQGLERKRIHLKSKNLPISEWPKVQKSLLAFYADNGYPFASVRLDSVQLQNEIIGANVVIRKGNPYKIDSIRVLGNAKIRNKYLQQYLEIFNGEPYNESLLQDISKKINELGFVKEDNPWNLTMLGTGAILNLYLSPKRSSQVDVLVGFLPSSTPEKKSQLTADVNLNLNNTLAAGENILIKWQQFQPQSPKLNLGYSQPYIMNSKFGIDFSFNLFKQDSAYLQIQGIAGVNYLISASQAFRIFYQPEKSYLLSGGFDTNHIILNKKLPPNIDVSSDNLGLGYQLNKTDYRFNPRRGTELSVTGAAGIRKVKRNNDIININGRTEEDFDYASLYDSVKLTSYRIRFTGAIAQYFPIGKNSALKTGLKGGLLQSPQNFLNELFRIGGYQILRGFDEESIYTDHYVIGTLEYRFLTGVNSYFFGFTDFGYSHSQFSENSLSNTYLSGGLGLEFETKFGLLNISYAVGKRNDVKFDIQSASKIHFGYINYF